MASSHRGARAPHVSWRACSSVSASTAAAGVVISANDVAFDRLKEARHHLLGGTAEPDLASLSAKGEPAIPMLMTISRSVVTAKTTLVLSVISSRPRTGPSFWGAGLSRDQFPLR